MTEDAVRDSTAGGVQADGRVVRITHPERVLWPAARFTKRQMLEYYAAVAPVLLAHLRDRPLVLGRWPEGVDQPGWLQAECRGRPDWMRVHAIPGTKQVFSYCLVDDLGGLLHLANLGTIELHPFHWRLPVVEPSYAVFDLDPGPPASLAGACRVALLVRERLTVAGLEGVAKTSGSLGLHVYVPVARGQTFAACKSFVQSVARSLAVEHPELVVLQSARSARAGRVFVDWAMNAPTRQLASVYSLRAVSWPLVSTPVTWAEIEDIARSGRDERLRFEPRDVVARLDRLGDLAAGLLAASRGVLPVSEK